MADVTMNKEENPSFILVPPNKLTYEERPVPSLSSPYDVVVRVNWTGICGSDVHYWVNGRIGPYVVEKPMVLGHESSGTVSRVGDGVKTLQVGDRVALEPGVPCRRCTPCKSGSYNLCELMAFASTPPYDGTLAKYYVLAEDLCYKLPEHVSLEEGALVEPAAVATHIVRQGGVRPGDDVVVFGAGPVGLLCAGVARAFGANKVVVVDIQEHRVEFARGWVAGGAAGYVPQAGKNAVENAAAIIAQNGLEGKGGADVVIDASGAAPSVNTGVHLVRRGGTYVQGGMGRDEINFPIMAMCTKEVTCKGSFRYHSGDYDTALRLVADGKLDVQKLITDKVGFREAERAYEAVKAGKGIKILIEGVQD